MAKKLPTYFVISCSNDPEMRDFVEYKHVQANIFPCISSINLIWPTSKKRLSIRYCKDQWVGSIIISLHAIILMLLAIYRCCIMADVLQKFPSPSHYRVSTPTYHAKYVLHAKEPISDLFIIRSQKKWCGAIVTKRENK